MSEDGEGDAFADAIFAARLCAVDPSLGGLILRGGGELRDAVVAELLTALPEGAPLKRLPVHVDAERLSGGIDLTATLATGRPVRQPGLLAEAEGGVLVVPMAERLQPERAAQIAAALDGGARFVVVALDDGTDDEQPPGALAERAGFWIDLSQAKAPPPRGRGSTQPQAERGAGLSGPAPPQSRRPHPNPSPKGEGLELALTATAAALGIDSARAPQFALKTARASAQLAARDQIADADLILAARLVLAPRATRMPEAAPAQPEPPPPAEGDSADRDTTDPTPLEDIVLAAALAALPRDVLARIAEGRGRATSRAQGAGERRKSKLRGRPLGARAGQPGGGARLALIDTLRAAAPWQRLRGGGGRVQIRRDDLRIRRFETRAEALTIFAVDASGSSALARLAEAKGAVELLLAEAYVKRAQVALIAFRGSEAELLLPPTRSLTRARRSLADLPGGGGTPLAAGLTAARELAEAAKARGRTPFIVVLTDGRANIAADGSSARGAAEADAKAAAKALGAAGIPGVFVDTSTRPRPEGEALAAAMRARYLPLPRADAAAMHAAIGAAQRG